MSGKFLLGALFGVVFVLRPFRGIVGDIIGNLAVCRFALDNLVKKRRLPYFSALRVVSDVA
jgi:hypothetical protein